MNWTEDKPGGFLRLPKLILDAYDRAELLFTDDHINVKETIKEIARLSDKPTHEVFKALLEMLKRETKIKLYYASYESGKDMSYDDGTTKAYLVAEHDGKFVTCHRTEIVSEIAIEWIKKILKKNNLD